MSDASPQLPVAAVDITAYRSAATRAAAPLPGLRAGLVVFGIALLILIAAVVVTAILGARGSAGPVTTELLEPIAVGLAGTGVLFALFVVLPAQLAVRHRRRLVAEVARQADAAAVAVRTHLSGMGYDVPLDTALAWLESPTPAATIPLVHDSVIAARWWRPAPDDERVFVEPYLRRSNGSSVLPAR